MAMKDFNKKDLLVGGIVLTILFVGMVYLSLIIYKVVGQTATNVLGVVAICFYVWQAMFFGKNPKAKYQYLGNLHGSLYAGDTAFRRRALAYGLNLSALIALVLLGWWFALMTAVVLTVWVCKHLREAQMVIHRAPVV